MPRSKTSKKVAIITGGASGIGYGCAEAFLKAGYDVMIADLDGNKGLAAARALSVLGNVRAQACDISKEAQVKRMIAETVKHFSGIDALINNAALANPVNKAIETMTLSEWNSRLAVNLDGTFLCVKYAIPHLRKRRGSIINMSSTRALMSEPNTEIYAASKGGIDAFSHALAISLGPDIRVNVIRPGWIHTTDRKSLKKKDHAQHPAGRVGEPQDIASLAVFLASQDAGFITGQAFNVDGGLTAKMIYS